MSISPIHVCSFASTDHLRGRKRTYNALKAAALDAGRFSVFEATETPSSARMFDRLVKDPEVERFDMPFPWCGIRKRVTPMTRDEWAARQAVTSDLLPAPDYERAIRLAAEHGREIMWAIDSGRMPNMVDVRAMAELVQRLDEEIDRAHRAEPKETDR